jgi:Spy/CpxP family protein refolding chaperone
MKPRILVLALAFCVPLVSISYAQPKERAQRLAEVAKQLNLTRDQEKQLAPILMAEEPQLQAIKNDQSLSKVEKLRRLRAIHDQSNPQVKAILTPAQYQQLQDMRHKRRAQLVQDARSRANQGGAARSR